MNVAERIREEWTPDHETIDARIADSRYTAGWLKVQQDIAFRDDDEAEQVACALTWARWMVETGRISERRVP